MVLSAGGGEADADRDAIVACALDYYEGWFDGERSRMERALHPLLIKRALSADGFDTDSAGDMIEATAAGVGVRRDPGDRRIHVFVDHVHGSIATAAVTSAVYVDYLHLVKVDGRWTILHALWAPA